MAQNAGNGSAKQIFVTTRSPFFVNALKPEQIWVLENGEDGFSYTKCAAEFPYVKALADSGALMGDLWCSGYLE